jgi:tetratricopeptide (TPR) repeat protein
LSKEWGPPHYEYDRNSDYDKAIDDLDMSIEDLEMAIRLKSDDQPDVLVVFTPTERHETPFERDNGGNPTLGAGVRVELYRSLALAYSLRGRAWIESQEYDKAIRYFDEKVGLNPKIEAAYYWRAIAWIRKGNYDNAIKDFDKAISLDPDAWRPYLRRGNAWQSKRDHDKAIQDFDEAIRRAEKEHSILRFRAKDELAIAYNNRGDAWTAKDDHDKAIMDYDEAIRLAPENAVYYQNRGDAWAAKKDQDKAITDFDKARRLDRRQRTRPVPQKLEINIPGALSVLTLGGFAAFAETPGIIEISPTMLGEAQDRQLANRKQRLEKLLLKAPDGILQIEIRMINRLQAWKDGSNQPEDYAYLFKAKEEQFECSEFAKAVANLSALTQLEHLDLTGCSVTDAGLAQLRLLPNLRGLCLSNCRKITDQGLAHLGVLTRLNKLALAGCSVTDRGLAHLAGLKNLRELDLAGCNKITEDGVAALMADLPNCEVV